MKNLLRIFRYFKEDKCRIILLFTAIPITAILDVIVTYLFTWLDSTENDFVHILTIFSIMLILTLILSLAGYWISISLKKISNKIMKKIQTETMQEIYNSKVEYLEKFEKGEIINRLTDDLGAVDQVITQITPSVVSSIFYIAVSAIAIYTIHPFLFLISILMILIYLLAFSQLNKRIIKNYRKMRSASDEQMNMVDDMVSGITDVRLWKIHDGILGIFSKVQELFFQREYKLTSISKATSSIYGLIKTIANCIVMLLGFWLIYKGNIGIGGLIAIFIYLNNLYTPVIDLFDAMNDVNKCSTNLDRIYQFSNENSKQVDEIKYETAEKINSICFKDVSFNYGEQKVLDNISISLEAGKIYGLTGVTGSGKSTLLKVLCGYYKPSGGKLFVNKKEVSYEEYSKIINRTYPLFQDAHIFNLTISEIENLYRDNSGQEHMVFDEKMKFVMLEELLDRQNEKVGDGGNLLSGGQRQRLNLLRVLNGSRDLVILDESTTSLDKATQSTVMKRLNAYFKDSILVICSHDKELFSDVDETYQIKNGEIFK